MDTPSNNHDRAPSQTLPFGPYEGRAVAWVAIVDPPYLRELIAEGIGSAELRAAAARALVGRGHSLAAWRGRFAGRFSRPSARAGPSGDASRSDPSRADQAPLGMRGIMAYLSQRLAIPTAAVRAWPVAAIAISGTLLIGWRISVTSEVPAPTAMSGTPSARPGVPSANAEAAFNRVTSDPTSPARLASTARAIPTPAQTPSPGTPPPCGARISGAIPATSAVDFIDTFQAVEFQVAGTKDTGKVTFLNSHDPYQGHFYVAIFPDDYALYPAHPAQHFRGRCIVVQGRIERYRGVPQIVLRGPQDVRVIDEPTAVNDEQGGGSYTESMAPAGGIP